MSLLKTCRPLKRCFPWKCSSQRAAEFRLLNASRNQTLFRRRSTPPLCRLLRRDTNARTITVTWREREKKTNPCHCSQPTFTHLPPPGRCPLAPRFLPFPSIYLQLLTGCPPPPPPHPQTPTLSSSSSCSLITHKLTLKPSIIAYVKTHTNAHGAPYLTGLILTPSPARPVLFSLPLNCITHPANTHGFYAKWLMSHHTTFSTSLIKNRVFIY